MPHMTTYIWCPSELEVDRNWTGSGPEEESEGSTSAGRLWPVIFTDWSDHMFVLELKKTWL